MMDMTVYASERNDSVFSAADGREAGVTVPAAEGGFSSVSEMHAPLTDSLTGISMESAGSEALEGEVSGSSLRFCCSEWMTQLCHQW